MTMTLWEVRQLLKSRFRDVTLYWLGHRAADGYWINYVVPSSSIKILCCDWGSDIRVYSKSTEVVVSLERDDRKRDGWSLHRHGKRLLEEASRKAVTSRCKRVVLLPYFAEWELYKICASQSGWIWAAAHPSAKEWYGNKLRLGDIVRGAGVESVASVRVSLNGATQDRLRWLLKTDTLVIQGAEGATGSSTQLVTTQGEFLDARKRFGTQQVKVSRFVKGMLVNVNACNTRYGTLLGRPSLKLRQIDLLSSRPTAGCGNDWTHDLPCWIMDEISAIGRAVGQLMYRQRRVLGMWGMDLICDTENQKVRVIDINLRFQGTSNLENLAKIDAGLCPLGAFHLLEFLGIDYEVDVASYNMHSFNQTGGAYLKVYQIRSSPIRVGGEVAAGVYSLSERGLAYVREGLTAFDTERQREYVVTCRVPIPGIVIEPMELILKIECRGHLTTSDGQLTRDAKTVVKEIRDQLALKEI